MWLLEKLERFTGILVFKISVRHFYCHRHHSVRKRQSRNSPLVPNYEFNPILAGAYVYSTELPGTGETLVMPPELWNHGEPSSAQEPAFFVIY